MNYTFALNRLCLSFLINWAFSVHSGVFLIIIFSSSDRMDFVQVQKKRRKKEEKKKKDV